MMNNMGLFFSKLKVRRHKKGLRELGVEMYGEQFGIDYDTLNSGSTIGNLNATICFLDKVNEVREASTKGGK